MVCKKICALRLDEDVDKGASLTPDRLPLAQRSATEIRDSVVATWRTCVGGHHATRQQAVAAHRPQYRVKRPLLESQRRRDLLQLFGDDFRDGSGS